MGVDVDAMFMYGYQVGYDDIPDAAERFDNEFSDLADEPDGFEVTVCGEELFCSDLLTGSNAYCNYEDQDWFIGVGLSSGLTTEQLVAECDGCAQMVKTMYELVMRKPPSEQPKIHSFARWW